MLITRKDVVNRQNVDEIRVIGRATQGVRVVALDEGDTVMDMAVVEPEENGDEENGDGIEAMAEGGVVTVDAEGAGPAPSPEDEAGDA